MCENNKPEDSQKINPENLTGSFLYKFPYQNKIY